MATEREDNNSILLVVDVQGGVMSDTCDTLRVLGERSI